MTQRQLPPRYAVRYKERDASPPVLPRAGDRRTGVHTTDVLHEREATTLAGARSIQRALQRRGHRVQGIYERVGIRIRLSLDEHADTYNALVCGRLEWEWDAERPIRKT